ncbi:HAD family hydrolase [Serinicoccus kebangsaanensis]|uniref:HAD family hydrolase n=1 Tax=Serinicoccus kebangsaanensis TaxID=2602069 RepID=UPI002674EA92|nr:HAD family phosphatase [Serinicoccus kebangsaanensis]
MTRQHPDQPLPTAVLWDMDGTIVDTEPYWIAEEYLLVEEAGGRWTDEDAHDLVGQDLLTSARMILQRTPVQGAPEEVVRRLLDGVVVRTREHVPWRSGALELLAALRRAAVPCALVTMSWTELADVLVEQLPPGTFDAVVTGDQVTRGKPHPEAYLEAARRLGVDPGRAVAIEDSVTGATASTAAGVPTLVVPHMVPVPSIPGSMQVATLEGLAPADLGRLVPTLSSELHAEQRVDGPHDQA